MGNLIDGVKKLAGTGSWSTLRRFVMNDNKTNEQPRQETGEPLTEERNAPTPEAGEQPSTSAEHGEQKESAEDTGALLQQLEAVTAQVDDYKDRLLRQAAELENFRKRSLREKEELRKFATSGMIEDFIPALDNLKLGLSSARQHHPEAKAVLDGIEMVVTQLRGILTQHGVQEIEPARGESFNPNLHEAAAHLPDEAIVEGAILSVQRTGYRLHDRLLRAATVVVSQGPEASSWEVSSNAADS
jgi:molecular chaperone GrpE